MGRKERRKMERQFRSVAKKLSKKTGKSQQDIVNEMMTQTQREIPLVPPPGTSTIPSEIKQERGGLLRSIFSKSIFGGNTKKA